MMAGISIALLAVLIGGVGGSVHTAVDRRRAASDLPADGSTDTVADEESTRTEPVSSYVRHDAPTKERVAPEVTTKTTNEPAQGAQTDLKPAALDAPRNGTPDDLTRIRGVGAKLTEVCNSMGFWHFDQIASWSEDEAAWVDANLPRFKGRVSRDDWVAQARELVAAQCAPTDD